MAEPQAIYSLELHFEFIGPLPTGPINKAAPEVSPAQREAVVAVENILKAHGFTVAGIEGGSRREGTYIQ